MAQHRVACIGMQSVRIGRRARVVTTIARDQVIQLVEVLESRLLLSDSPGFRQLGFGPAAPVASPKTATRPRSLSIK